MTKIVIVDENDNIIWYKERYTLSQEDISRVTALYVENSNRDILLQQRSFSKKNQPWIWQPAVAGTVDEWETYESNIIKETQEEIWIDLTKYDYKLFRKYIKDQNLWVWEHKHFTAFYHAIIDKDIEEFTFPKDEVESLKWISKEDLEKDLQKNPQNYVSSMPVIYKMFYDWV